MLFLLLTACQKDDKRFLLVDASQTGIHFVNLLTETPEQNILTYLYFYNGAGVATADFNNDGLLDLYFVSNQGADKIYKNLGNLQFEDITKQSGIKNDSGWSTGVTTVDINHDGRMDIYVCQLGAYKTFRGVNKLFVNIGNDEAGNPLFEEQAAKYGLDIQSNATQAAFFDADNDGDLDFYLLNHSTHPNSNYGNGSKRDTADLMAGDRFYLNEGGTLREITQESGIHNGIIGYGLGLGLGDLNNDGYTDLYIANDFFENDYLYLNKQNNTFEDLISKNEQHIGHTSHFSMGVDIADFNNDALADIFVLDMLPENPITYQRAGRDYPFQIYEQYKKNGYAYQFMQNTLQQNLGNNQFAESAYLRGIAATDWSWAPLFADLNNDGFKDLFVSNGIPGATNDMDFISFIANEKIQKKIQQGLKKEDLSLTKDLPEIKISNYFFENQQGERFSDQTQNWFGENPSFSNGALYADLDNDGDLDVVTNNLMAPAFVYENKSDEREPKHHFLKIQFAGKGANRFGIGAKIIAFTGKNTQLFENYTTRGYLSAVAPEIQVGLGETTTIDSLVAIWPGGHFQVLKNVKTNQTLTLKEAEAGGDYYKNRFQKEDAYLMASEIDLPFSHQDNDVLEFVRDPLVPYATTNLGPKLAVADVNGDGLEDLFVGNGKWEKPALYLQQPDGSLVNKPLDLTEEDAKGENTAALFFDANGDDFPELILLHGGNEFTTGKPLQPLYFRNENGVLVKDSLHFQNIYLNGAVVRTLDFDNDGDLDLFLGANLQPWKFGQTPQSYLFENDGKGNFTDVTQKVAPVLTNLGNIYDAAVADMDKDGFPDLVLVGHWMPITVLKNLKGRFETDAANKLQNTHGLWNSIQISDFNLDGKADILAGNWGLNSRLSASLDEPVQLFVNDFDDNGAQEPVVSYFYKGKRLAFASKDEIVSQIPEINKRYLSYQSFAEARFEDIFGKQKLAQSLTKHLYTLKTSLFLQTDGGQFAEASLPNLMQISAVTALYVDDINGDGYPDIVGGGNWHELNTQLSRLDASRGFLLLNDGRGGFPKTENANLTTGAVRDIQKIHLQNQAYLVLARNNHTLQFLKIKP
jgi:hypothetical protein